MDKIQQELNDLLKKLVMDDDKVTSAIAEEVQDIMSVFESDEIDEQTKDELIQDAIELSQVESEALALEAKIKVEQVFNLLMKLAKLI